MDGDIRNKIIIALSAIVAILIMFRGCGKSEPCPKVGVIVERDSIPYEVEVEVPVPVTVVTTNWLDRSIYDTLYREVDSSGIFEKYIDTISLETIAGIIGEARVLEMLEDYNSKVYYSDTITKDGDFVAIINDTIHKNRIHDRSFFLQNLREDRVITIDNSRRRLLVGGALTANGSYFDISPSVGFMNKRGSLIDYSYGVINKTHQVGIRTTIKIK